ncbi:peptidase M75 [Hyphomicrobium methylovorum]|nr:peptidase M75 [Hyphomicrobium methylovorum]
MAFAVGSARAAETPPTHKEIVRAAIEKHILPHFDALKAATGPLPDAVRNVCKTGSPEARAALDTAFANVVTAYAGVDYMRFGPMAERGRRERLSFWPDPRGFVGRQLRLILLNKDPAVLEPGAIAKQSVAVQGLSALEVLIRDKAVPLGPGEAADYRCKLAEIIAKNIQTVAGEVTDAWEAPGGWRDTMEKAGPDNPVYKSDSEAAAETVKTLLMGMSLTSDLQIKPQIDPTLKLAGAYEKSGLQSAYYLASIASLKNLFDTLKLQAYLPEDKDWVMGWISGAWRAFLSTDGVGGRGPKAQEGRKTPPLREVFDKFVGMRKLITGELCPDARITVGFNELDGD